MLVRALRRTPSPAGAPAVFVDRDGVLNRRVPDGYVLKPTELVLLDGVLPVLERATSLGFPIVIVSNQGCISRGLLTETALDAIHDVLLDRLSGAGIAIDAIYVCPHHPAALDPSDRSCGCRKPKPGLILAAARELGLEISRSLMIGDQDSDRRAAEAAGVEDRRFYLVDGELTPSGSLAPLDGSIVEVLKKS